MAISESLPISVKGIVIENGRIWLRKNPRNEWELPGGRLDKGEQPEATVVRELQEELGFDSQILDIVHSGVLDIELPTGTKSVLVLSYLCELKSKSGSMEFAGEDGAAEFQAFLPSELASLKMPALYRDAVQKALKKI